MYTHTHWYAVYSIVLYLYIMSLYLCVAAYILYLESTIPIGYLMFGMIYVMWYTQK